ncbi:MAG: helix-turn-helix protein [Firmicutes bacterium ADurb.Bin467]|jgi:transcriptional regulator with XRE-family HTH domain|nr:MAG: helix-turn-helix protein [Firmicutes bacterium ADurb.Bin467]
MPLNIGEVIATKRREKAWTQEQLAYAVGVSTPAVSKWETGATYPDITLLSPIARALSTTVDALLSFQNELSEREVEEFMRKAAGIYESEGFDAGWSFCEKMLREYPNSIPLKFHLGNLFQSFLLLKPGIDQQGIQACYRRAANLIEEVLASGHAKYTYPSTIILVGYYAMLNQLDRAEELLDNLPRMKVDPDQLYPSIYALRGRHDEAIKLIQENIRRYLPRISQALDVLCAYARERDEMDKAFSLAKINYEVTKLFGVKTEIAYPEMIKGFASQGDMQAALDYLEDYAESILEWHYDYANNPVFDKLAEQAVDMPYVRKVLAQSILTDNGYAPLKEEPRYSLIISKLCKMVETETHMFDISDG